MIIKNEDNATIYTCSICGHQHIKYSDGTSVNEPFTEHPERVIRIKVLEYEDNSRLDAKRKIRVKHTGYTCPICGKLQANVDEMKEYDN